MVQFAKKLSIDPSAPSAPEPQVALKFYMDPELIRVETAVYGNPTLATFGALPKSAQLHLKTTDEMQTCAGAPLPPCLIMERGMSLKEWMTHSRMSTHSLASDCKTAIKVLPPVIESVMAAYFCRAGTEVCCVCSVECSDVVRSVHANTVSIDHAGPTASVTMPCGLAQQWIRAPRREAWSSVVAALGASLGTHKLLPGSTHWRGHSCSLQPCVCCTRGCSQCQLRNRWRGACWL